MPMDDTTFEEDKVVRQTQSVIPVPFVLLIGTIRENGCPCYSCTQIAFCQHYIRCYYYSLFYSIQSPVARLLLSLPTFFCLLFFFLSTITSFFFSSSTFIHSFIPSVSFYSRHSQLEPLFQPLLLLPLPASPPPYSNSTSLLLLFLSTLTTNNNNNPRPSSQSN